MFKGSAPSQRASLASRRHDLCSAWRTTRWAVSGRSRKETTAALELTAVNAMHAPCSEPGSGCPAMFFLT